MILETGTATASNRDRITVRYDTRSPSAAEADAATVQAINGTDKRTKERTVFSVSWALKFSGKLDRNNPTRFPLESGTDTDICEFNWRGERGATVIAAKTEATCSFSPTEVNWKARGVDFKYGDQTGAKFSLRLMRLKVATTVGQPVTGPKRIVVSNDRNLEYDGVSTSADTDYPNRFHRNTAFSIDGPSINPSRAVQAAKRSYYREIAEWHDGVNWRQISVSSEGDWHVNETAVLPNGAQGGVNDDGPGIQGDCTINHGIPTTFDIDA